MEACSGSAAVFDHQRVDTAHGPTSVAYTSDRAIIVVLLFSAPCAERLYPHAAEPKNFFK